MKLEAKIARIQLNSLPQLIAERLLKHRDVAVLIDAGSAEVVNVGQLTFVDVRNALATAPFGDFVNASGPDGARVWIARSTDALFKVRGPSGVEVPLPELSLLDSSAEVRLEGIRYLSDRALPSWPSSLSWEERAFDGPLADNDFGTVLNELQGVGEPVLHEIILKLEGSTFGILEIVPTHSTYYESILGPVPWSTGASQYVSETLVPHLTAVFKKNPAWGLRCLQAACITEAVDPVTIGALVSNDDLLSAIESVGRGHTPCALLVTYKLASSRASIDERFSEISRYALDRLIESTCASERTSHQDELLISLVKLTLSVIGQSEELALAPAFWRRLAAFAHATILIEAIHISDDCAKELVAWLATGLTKESAAIELLDHLVEPGWHSGALRAQGLWASALLRATQSASEGAESAPLLPTQLEQAAPHLLLVARVPDPLSGARRNWATYTSDVLSEDLLDSIQSTQANGEAIEPVRIWMVLAHHAQIYRFDDGLLLRIRSLFQASMPSLETTLSDAYAVLELCCNVASNQADLELAEVVVARVIEACERFTDPSDASLAAVIVLLAAGAEKDQPASLQWAADKLLALAYRLPRGASCAALAGTISTFQRLIPLGKRRWGKALIVANSAAT